MPEKSSPGWVQLVATYLPIVLLIGMYVYGWTHMEELLAFLNHFFTNYGYVTIFVASLIEAILIINVGVPGGLTALLGASLAGQGRPLSLELVIILGTIGPLIGYAIDYHLGKAYKKIALLDLEWLNKLLNKVKWQVVLPMACIHPNYGAWTTFSLGVARKPFWMVMLIAFFAQLFWTGFWGNLASRFGMEFMLTLLRSPILLIGLSVLYIAGRYFVLRTIKNVEA